MLFRSAPEDFPPRDRNLQRFLEQFLEKHDFTSYDDKWPVLMAYLYTAQKVGGPELLPALEELGRAGGGKPLAGIVLVSDGADNGALADAIDSGDEAKAIDVKRRLKALGAPVFVVDVAGGELRDLAVSSVKVDDFAFVRSRIELEDVGAAIRNLSDHALGLNRPIDVSGKWLQHGALLSGLPLRRRGRVWPCGKNDNHINV